VSSLSPDAENALGTRDLATSILATMHQPFLVLGYGLVVEAANASFYRVFEVDAEETLGSSLFELGDRQWDIPELRSLLGQVVDSDIPFEDYQVEHVFSDVGHKIMRLNARRLVQSDEQSVRVLLAIEDVTDRVLKERALVRLNRKLQFANDELNAFSYSVSHDLRTPLRAIDGFSQALLEDYDDELDETGRHYLRRVRAGAQRMSGLIDDLLQLSRLARSRPQRQEADLSALARRVVEGLRQSEPDRAVNCRIADGLVVGADPGLLRALLYNLLGNAWKFTSRRDEACIELGASTDDREPVYWVRDNGAGFDMAYADKLFGVFQRLHSQDEFEGSGIGLATVQRIVRLHGGRIWAEGAVDGGATFYFTLGGDEPAAQGIASPVARGAKDPHREE
jgi:signal transduction histidine kinase